jgi:hypothetical protein
LEKVLETGEQYEIIAKRTPGRNITVHRRNSVDLSTNPPRRAGKDEKPLAVDFTPERACDEPASVGKIPSDWSVEVTFQLEGQPEFKWRGWYTENDTEMMIVEKAKAEKNVRDAVRRIYFWADKEGVRITVTKRRKSTKLRYIDEGNAEVQEEEIAIDETPKSFLERLRKPRNTIVQRLVEPKTHCGLCIFLREDAHTLMDLFDVRHQYNFDFHW